MRDVGEVSFFHRGQDDDQKHFVAIRVEVEVEGYSQRDFQNAKEDARGRLERLLREEDFEMAFFVAAKRAIVIRDYARLAHDNSTTEPNHWWRGVAGMRCWTFFDARLMVCLDWRTWLFGLTVDRSTFALSFGPLTAEYWRGDDREAA